MHKDTPTYQCTYVNQYIHASRFKSGTATATISTFQSWWLQIPDSIASYTWRSALADKCRDASQKASSTHNAISGLLEPELPNLHTHPTQTRSLNRPCVHNGMGRAQPKSWVLHVLKNLNHQDTILIPLSIYMHTLQCI